MVIPVLLYTVAAHRPRRVSVTALAVCLLATGVAITRWAPTRLPASSNLLFIAAAGLGGTALAAWVLGDSMAYRYRREYYASLEERTARAEAERDAQTRIAAAAQRTSELQHRRALAIDESAARLRQIERDLHDGAQVRLAASALRFLVCLDLRRPRAPGAGWRRPDALVAAGRAKTPRKPWQAAAPICRPGGCRRRYSTTEHLCGGLSR